MEIRFVNTASVLSTRNLGEKFRTDIERQFRAENFVTFDFEGVETISNSFADECFAKLLFEFSLATIKSHSTFKNTNKFVEQIISLSIKQRLKQLESA